MLSCIPALLCDERASHLGTVPWALQGRVAVPKEGMCDCLVADRVASLYVAFGSLIFQMLPCFFPLKYKPCVPGEPGLLQGNAKAGSGAGSDVFTADTDLTTCIYLLCLYLPWQCTTVTCI